MGHPVASVVKGGAGEEGGERSNTVNTIVAVQGEKFHFQPQVVVS